MSKKSILWFSRSGDFSSFSRITDSILPRLSKYFDITLLSNNTESTESIKSIKVGSDSKSITYADYIRGSGSLKSTLELNMNYIVIQIADLIVENKYDYLVICNGIYETGFFAETISKNKYILGATKLVVWAPIDYIPGKELINRFSNVDIFLTMTPVMADIIKKIIGDTTKIGWVGHGSDHNLVDAQINGQESTRKKLIKNMNNKRNTTWSGQPLKEDDIIILNANNCKHTNRKRLDITIDSFFKIYKKFDNLKLWIHTDLDTFRKTIPKEKILDNSRIIISNNNVSDKILSDIYKICQINLQTSTGEGWSMTNLESALYGSLQVVPNFLACGFHFSEGRGILIPVTETIQKNELGQDIIVGIVSVEDTANKLEEAIEIIKSGTNSDIIKESKNYAKQYTWDSISKSFIDLLV